MRKAIVTAASKGIGWRIAEYLLKSGNAVGITSRSSEDLEDLKARNSDLFVNRADHRNPEETKDSIRSLGTNSVD